MVHSSHEWNLRIVFLQEIKAEWWIVFGKKS
jgi:hypothetical protein